MSDTRNRAANRAELAAMAAHDLRFSRHVNHRLDRWGVINALYELRGVHLNRWSPEIRALAHEARELLERIAEAMRRESEERGLWR